ncbi:MAG: hypothetical protein HGA42_19515, partial [Nostocales cyanobacterium W4_Combined_metabat2_030]|nr:hypothetical protein [Nostocales cyanobacterium W4_Combined_metabat2_030]
MAKEEFLFELGAALADVSANVDVHGRHANDAPTDECATGVPPTEHLTPARWQLATDSSFDAPNSLKSGPVLDNQRADIETTVTTGEGTMSFARRVSSEPGFDFLRFYVDGVQVAWWSGDVAWEVVGFSVSAGSHVFRWSYQKDVTMSDGLFVYKNNSIEKLKTSIDTTFEKEKIVSAVKLANG